MIDLEKNYPHIKLALKRTHQLWIELHNPTQKNAITYDMITSLTTVLKLADFDRDIRVIVLAGANGAFCAGGDIQAMKDHSGMFQGEADELRQRYMHGIQEIPKTIEEMSTPLLAMVNGPAIGAGCDLSFMCDLRIGSPMTKFGETFTKLGLVPGDGGTFFLTRAIGFSKAMQLFLTGDLMEGMKAYEFGLLNFFVEHDQDLEKKTEELAHKISHGAPIAMGMTKKALKHSYLNDLYSSLDLLASFQGITQRTADHQEAILALVEKRKSQFTGY